MTLKKVATVCAVTAVLSAAITLGLIYLFKGTVCLLASIAATALYLFILDIIHPRPRWFFISKPYIRGLLLPFVLLLWLDIYIYYDVPIFNSSKIYVSGCLFVLLTLLFTGYTIAVVYCERKNSLFWLRVYAAAAMIFVLYVIYSNINDISKIEYQLYWPGWVNFFGIIWYICAICSLLFSVITAFFYSYNEDLRREFPKTQSFGIDDLIANTFALVIIVFIALILLKTDIYLTLPK